MGDRLKVICGNLDLIPNGDRLVGTENSDGMEGVEKGAGGAGGGSEVDDHGDERSRTGRSAGVGGGGVVIFAGTDGSTVDDAGDTEIDRNLEEFISKLLVA